MLRRILVLLAAPVLTAAAQTPASGEVQVLVSTGMVNVTMSSAGYQIVASKLNEATRVPFRSTSLPIVDSLSQGKQPLLRGRGTISWSLPVEAEVSLAATDSTDVIRVELREQGRPVAFATGRPVTLRRHGEVVTLDGRRDGPLAVPQRPPGQ